MTGASMFLTGAVVCLSMSAQTSRAQDGYHLEPARPTARFDENRIAILEKLNHADRAHLDQLKQLVVPDRWDFEQLAYSPMPSSLPWLSANPKTLVIELGAQVFGGYEQGVLVRWGPVSSGARSHPTPASLYHLTWRSRLRRSSEPEHWLMPWYFNFDTIRGRGLHQYSLPGRPASHGCVRLLVTDAKWLFEWGEGWVLDFSTNEVARSGTPVVIVGAYDFSAAPPWTKPEWWGHSIAISEFYLRKLQ